MSGRRSRNKGKRGERELVNLIAEHCGDGVAKRNLQQTAEGGYDLAGPIADIAAVECKNEVTFRLTSWMRQAEEQAGPEQVPVVAHRQYGGGFRFYLSMDEQEFMQWIRERL